MPFYYQGERSATTNATPLVENNTDLLFLSAAAVPMGITTINVNARSPSGTSLAGAAINIKRAGTAGSGGSALTTVGPAHPSFPAKLTAITTGGTTGTTLVQQKTVGCAAPGGAGGWMAITEDAAIQLKAAGAAGGNLETSMIAGLPSIVVDYSFDFFERL